MPYGPRRRLAPEPHVNAAPEPAPTVLQEVPA